MFIKFVHNDGEQLSVELYECFNYSVNFVTAADTEGTEPYYSIHLYGGSEHQECRVYKEDRVKIFVLNNQGKTIDRITPKFSDAFAPVETASTLPATGHKIPMPPVKKPVERDPNYNFHLDS